LLSEKTIDILDDAIAMVEHGKVILTVVAGEIVNLSAEKKIKLLDANVRVER
jgi:hypothetical protein